MRGIPRGLILTLGLFLALECQAEGGLITPLDPGAFASLGVLGLFEAGPNAIYRTELSTPGGLLFHGVVAGGVAVFDFDSITIGPNVSLQVTGGLPLVLLSRGDVVVNGQINASANSGGGPGGGGPGTDMLGGSGGGGFGGKGGSGGGRGGSGGAAYPPSPGPFDLSGGSGGGASTAFGGANVGGAGGGAIEISAQGRVLVSGTGGIFADGGLGGHTQFNSAGGGSGGLIFLHGDSVSALGILEAVGGNGGTNGVFSPSGGGGGGGWIYILTGPGGFSGRVGSRFGFGPVAGGGGAHNGSDGLVILDQIVPEPASVSLVAFGFLGVLAWVGFTTNVRTIYR